MAEKRVDEALPSRNRQPGTFTFGPIEADPDISAVTVYVHRLDWLAHQPGEFASVYVEASFDRGATWEGIGGGGFGGGLALDRELTPVPWSTAIVPLQQVGRAGRLVRGRYTSTLRHTVRIDVRLHKDS